jgi:hypothetical protein
VSAEGGLLAAVAEYQAAAEALRSLIREGRKVIQEMREVIREAEAAGVEVRRVASTAVDEQLAPVVERELAELGPKLDEFKADVFARIDDLWQKYTDLLMGRTVSQRRGGRPSLDELGAAIGDAAGPGLPPVLGQVPAAFIPAPGVRPRPKGRGRR